MTDKQSPHWADQVTQKILAWQKEHHTTKLHVDDMKTPSGRVHTGSLRGVVLHDVIAKCLQNQKTIKKDDVISTYVFNDMDPMDGLPGYLNQEIYQKEMGKPLYKIPTPDLNESGIDLSTATKEELADFEKAKNFAEFYALDFVHAIRKLGNDQKIIWSSKLYESGSMDEVIRIALDSVDIISQVYKEVADYNLPRKWYPFQVNCPQCGKVGTTLVTNWDGQLVTFECQSNKVNWAVGCGHQGKISPFGGTGKLLWKVDWPAHWSSMGVNIEGAGKDHTSAGGSRDMANALCERVFSVLSPFDIPYEWILVRGAKMSSSKGIGTSAREFTSLFPSEVGRYIFINKHYNQVIDFDPIGMAIPDLFDEFDLAARLYWGVETGDTRLARSFELSQVSSDIPKPHFQPRFRDLALWMQYPEINLEERMAEVKGSVLNDTELAVLNQRKHYAQLWIKYYAPEEYQWTVKLELPESTQDLSAENINFVLEICELIKLKKWDPQELQQAIFDKAKTSIGPKTAFQSIYLAFLGKKSGPRAGWFLLSIDENIRDQRQKQLKNIINL